MLDGNSEEQVGAASPIVIAAAFEGRQSLQLD